MCFLVAGFDGLDTGSIGSKEEEYWKIVFLFNWKYPCFVINDHKLDLTYSLNKIILDLFPVFLDLQKPGTDNLDPDYFPGSPRLNRRLKY